MKKILILLFLMTFYFGCSTAKRLNQTRSTASIDIQSQVSKTCFERGDEINVKYKDYSESFLANLFNAKIMVTHNLILKFEPYSVDFELNSADSPSHWVNNFETNTLNYKWSKDFSIETRKCDEPVKYGGHTMPGKFVVTTSCIENNFFDALEEIEKKLIDQGDLAALKCARERAEYFLRNAARIACQKYSRYDIECLDPRANSTLGKKIDF